MPDDIDVREAGRRISRGGLTDDVIQARGEQITQRRGQQRDAADTDAKPKRKPAKREPVRDELDDGDDDHDYDPRDADGDEDELDDDADASNPDEEDDEGGDEDDSSDDADADDEDGQTADDEREHVVKVNGKEFKVTTSELIAGYQRGSDYHQKTQALAQRNRELTGSHTKVAETYVRKLQQTNAVLGGVRELLIGDMNSAEMKQLRHSDPQAWMIAREEMQDRISQVDAVLTGLHQEHERHASEFQQRHQESMLSTVAQEKTKLLEAVPDWDTGGGQRLVQYLTKSGFTPDDLSNVIDSRMWITAEKARKWDEYQASRSKPAKRKAKPTPKSIRPGASQIRRNDQGNAGKRRDYDVARKKAAKTGDMRDAGRAISKLL